MLSGIFRRILPFSMIVGIFFDLLEPLVPLANVLNQQFKLQQP